MEEIQQFTRFMVTLYVCDDECVGRSVSRRYLILHVKQKKTHAEDVMNMILSWTDFIHATYLYARFLVSICRE